MGNSHSKQQRFGVIIALVMTGFGIGWLAGLSVSPVVSIGITSVTGVAAAVVSAEPLWDGIRRGSKDSPITCCGRRLDLAGRTR